MSGQSPRVCAATLRRVRTRRIDLARRLKSIVRTQEPTMSIQQVRHATQRATMRNRGEVTTADLEQVAEALGVRAEVFGDGHDAGGPRATRADVRGVRTEALSPSQLLNVILQARTRSDPHRPFRAGDEVWVHRTNEHGYAGWHEGVVVNWIGASLRVRLDDEVVDLPSGSVNPARIVADAPLQDGDPAWIRVAGEGGWSTWCAGKAAGEASVDVDGAVRTVERVHPGVLRRRVELSTLRAGDAAWIAETRDGWRCWRPAFVVAVVDDQVHLQVDGRRATLTSGELHPDRVQLFPTASPAGR